MSVTDTSLKAYADLLDSGELNRRQTQVLENLRYLRSATNLEVATEARLPINQVTPRMLELRKAGLVVAGGKRPCKITGNTAYVWTLANWTVHYRRKQ
tara:strand:+ start:45 stop:338 length:294 start_codon:yes stop_codon:yes gene_type:complete